MIKKLFFTLYGIAPLALCCDNFQDYFNEAIRLVHEEKNKESIDALEKAAHINPHHAPTYFNMGIIHKAMGNTLEAQKNLEQAIACNAHYHKAYTHLGPLYASSNRFDDAIACYEKLITLGQTCDEQILFNLAYWYTRKEQYSQAATYYKQVLAINQNQKDALYNLACILRYQGAFQESRSYYQQIIQSWPDFSHGLYGYAECCLALGDYQNGWHAFESRWKRDHDQRHFADKLWDGSPLDNKTIIVRAEYGQGDTLQFLRYAQLLKEQGATVILEAQHSLITLLKNCHYLDSVIPVQENNTHLPAHDYQVPIMSLPYYFKTTLDTIPTKIPYISVPESLITQWTQKLSADTNFKVGICWEGSPYYEQFKAIYSKKSIPLAAFAPLSSLPQVTLYSLQKMNGTEQLQSLPPAMQVHDFGPDFDHTNGRFMDTAAVIKNMDLIITTDTSVAHLAGALGKPVWVLLPIVADWRWMTQRSDTPWYPLMRLFRQPEVGRWDMLLNNVAQELATFLESKKTRTSKKPIAVMTEIQIGELIDKITILQIKNERIKDPAKLINIQTELSALLTTYQTEIPPLEGITQLWKLLKETNEKLWKIEDDIRDKERTRTFDQEFIDLARAVYYTNDERCRIKRDINMLTGSRLIEEKSYTSYA